MYLTTLDDIIKKNKEIGMRMKLLSLSIYKKSRDHEMVAS